MKLTIAFRGVQRRSRQRGHLPFGAKWRPVFPIKSVSRTGRRVDSTQHHETPRIYQIHSEHHVYGSIQGSEAQLDREVWSLPSRPTKGASSNSILIRFLNLPSASVNDQTHRRNALDAQSTSTIAILAVPQIEHSVVRNYLSVSAHCRRAPYQAPLSPYTWRLVRVPVKRQSTLSWRSLLLLGPLDQLLQRDPLHGHIWAHKKVYSSRTSVFIGSTTATTRLPRSNGLQA